MFVSPQLASMAVDRFTFDSPDEVGNLEDGVYMLSNLAALLIGWGIGWVIGGRLVSRRPSSARLEAAHGGARADNARDRSMKHLLYAMAGGALGSGARHLVNVGMGRWLGPGFPWWTFFVNVVGLLPHGRPRSSALALKFHGSIDLRTFLATGVLGGFTTFSAFSLDFAFLMQRQEHMQAALYLVGSVGALHPGALRRDVG